MKKKVSVYYFILTGLLLAELASNLPEFGKPIPEKLRATYILELYQEGPISMSIPGLTMPILLALLYISLVGLYFRRSFFQKIFLILFLLGFVFPFLMPWHFDTTQSVLLKRIQEVLGAIFLTYSLIFKREIFNPKQLSPNQSN